MEMQISYRAFLSYSHSDRSKAAWPRGALKILSRSIQAYRNADTFGPVPARLSPVFRDREELSAAGDLGESIECALAQSLALIVICSPGRPHRAGSTKRSAASSVFMEKTHIRSHNRWRPCASDTNERREEECFPPALRFHVGPDGVVTSEPAEPIATDLRRWRQPATRQTQACGGAPRLAARRPGAARSRSAAPEAGVRFRRINGGNGCTSALAIRNEARQSRSSSAQKRSGSGQRPTGSWNSC